MGILPFVYYLGNAALPGEGGGSGTGGSRREAAAGGNPHGPGGSSAQQPSTLGSGKLSQCPTGKPSTGTHFAYNKHTFSLFKEKKGLQCQVMDVCRKEYITQLKIAFLVTRHATLLL